MGVQYQGATVARSDAHFSNTSTSTPAANTKRHPDLVLRPWKEGMDFTLRLLAANRMSKVVELHCCRDVSSKHRLSEPDMHGLLGAMGANDSGAQDNDHGDTVVTEEYQGPNSDHQIQAGGLPYLEALSIIGSTSSTDTTAEEEDTASPSLIQALTLFLAASLSFPRFTQLSLEGVNLRGTALELRALAEAFRLHTKLQRVHMSGCWFSDAQQGGMDALTQVFQEQQQQHRASSVTMSRQQQLFFAKQGTPLMQQQQYPATATVNATTTTQKNTFQATTPVSTEDLYGGGADDHAPKRAPGDNPWWGERLFKICFCWW